MITSKENLKQYLEQDRVALHIERKKPRIIGDEIWKFQIALAVVVWHYRATLKRRICHA